jgi:hypothetical protein
MATNRVKCLCGEVFTASGYLKHISTIWKSDPTLSILSLQEMHKVVESVEIVKIARHFTPREVSEAETPKRKRR